MCAEFSLKIWGFLDKKLTIFSKYNVFRPVVFIKNINDFILFMFNGGDSCYLHCNRKEFVKVEYDAT